MVGELKKIGIPKYPEHRPLRLDDQAPFEERFRARPPEISEYTFANLYAWRDAYQFRVCCCEEALLLRCIRMGETLWFPPVTRNDPGPLLLRLVTRERLAFTRVPDAWIRTVSPNPGVRIRPETDQADYVYRLRDLAELQGRAYDAKRNHIHKLESTVRYAYEPLTPGLLREAAAFVEVWCRVKHCDEQESLGQEHGAVRELLAQFKRFGLFGGLIRTEAGVAAVAVAQALNPDTAVMHILKADPGIPGLTPALLQRFAQEAGKRFTWLNLEQDLGVPGLRRSKESYQPSRRIWKFRLEPEIQPVVQA